MGSEGGAGAAKAARVTTALVARGHAVTLKPPRVCFFGNSSQMSRGLLHTVVTLRPQRSQERFVSDGISNVKMT